jgi:hypothetical protein
MKKVIVLFAAMFIFLVSLFSQNKIIDLIITIDKEIVTAVSNEHFVIVDTIGNKNDTIRVFYFPGHLSIKETDFDNIVKNTNVIFYFSVGKSRKNKIINEIYHIDYKREWFFTTYSLLHIYNFETKEYKIITRDNDLDKYTYEFYSPEGFVLIRAKRL